MALNHKDQWQRRQVLRDRRQHPELFRPELSHQDNQVYRGSNRPELLGQGLLRRDNQPCQDSECRGLLYHGESASRLRMSNGPLVPPQNTIHAISAGERARR